MSFDVQNATKQPIAFYIPDIGCDFMSFTVTDPLTIPIDLPFWTQLFHVNIRDAYLKQKYLRHYCENKVSKNLAQTFKLKPLFHQIMTYIDFW